MPKKPVEGEEPADDDIDLVLDDEQGTEPVADEAATPDAAETAATELKAQLEAATKRAEEAERRAAEREAELQRREQDSGRVQADLQATQVQVIANAITATQGELRELRSARIAAKQNGDYEAEADAEEKLAMLTVKLQRLQEGKNELESKVEEDRASPKLPDDPVERYIAQSNLNPRSAAWVRAHGDVITDNNKTTQMIAAHWGAKAKGIAEGSDAYYRHIEDQLYGADVEDAEPETAPQRPTRRQAPAAPPSRDNGATVSGNGRTTIRLTAAQRDAARMSGLSDAEYAKNLLEIEREQQTTH